jgi:ABC-type anion transport system duplicated permease subunit
MKTLVGKELTVVIQKLLIAEIFQHPKPDSVVLFVLGQNIASTSHKGDIAHTLNSIIHQLVVKFIDITLLRALHNCLQAQL